MYFKTIHPKSTIALFVKRILVFEGGEKNAFTTIPFFADGYPGIVNHKTPNGQWIQPHNLKMPSTYLYGQTITPIELKMKGVYKMIVIQLYPFVLKNFFKLNPKKINDDCIDMLRFENWDKFHHNLISKTDTSKQIEIMEDYLYQLAVEKNEHLDFAIAESIQLILQSKQIVQVQEIADKVNLTLRTFQRRFTSEVGLSPKEFIQIIKFQQSLEVLTVKDYHKLSDIVYDLGYADQSHFIRVFKNYTGTSPKKFLNK